MFTGLVQAVGRVVALVPNDFGARLVIDRAGWAYKAVEGDSIAVCGCCLTYAPRSGDQPQELGFDVVRQTLHVTTLGRLKAGDGVNLESSLTPSSAMGGHFVQGHVDGTGVVERVESGEKECRVAVRLDEGLIRYVVPQGSIALDGVSLTVAALDTQSHTFEVALIPTTLRTTTLGKLTPQSRVNIEADMLVKTVVHTLRAWGERP